MPATSRPRVITTTTDLPDWHSFRSGDTDELVAVAASSARRRMSSTLGQGAAMVVLLAVTAALAFVPTSVLTGRDDGGATIEQLDGTAGLVDDGADDARAGGVPSAAIAPLDTEPPRWWYVIGVTAGLNVRATPGVDGELIGTLRADATLVGGTGRRVAVDGREWKQIHFGETVGWVSAAYLAPG